MKFDLAKLPVGEAIIGAMLLATVLSFLAAFQFSADGGIPDAVAEPTPTPPDGDGDGPPPGASIVMGDNFFEFGGEQDPAIPAAAGAEVTFDLTNDGLNIHNMRVSGNDSDYETDDDAVSDPDAMSGGDTGAITFTLDGPGEYPFRCDFHPIEMTGTVVVE